jgi:hypothetical protein
MIGRCRDGLGVNMRSKNIQGWLKGGKFHCGETKILGNPRFLYELATRTQSTMTSTLSIGEVSTASPRPRPHVVLEGQDHGFGSSSADCEPEKGMNSTDQASAEYIYKD